MFDKLKSLPLTIFLTILIWMYAESQVSSSRAEAKLTVNGVPVALSGPPEVLKSVLDQYDVVFEPAEVSVQVEGAPDRIEILRTRAMGGGQTTGIRAYVELTPEDRTVGGGNAGKGAGVMLPRHPLRVVALAEFVVLQAPESVSVRLVAKPAATSVPAVP